MGVRPLRFRPHPARQAELEHDGESDESKGQREIQPVTDCGEDDTAQRRADDFREPLLNALDRERDGSRLPGTSLPTTSKSPARRAAPSWS